MAGLFKNKIIREKVERYEIPDFEQKIALVKQWSDAYKNDELQKKNETQCEQAFNQDFFIHILGYSAFPKENYTIQPKDNVESGGGQMPDATLGYFNKENKRVVAVVEIKDANTSLDKSQYREGSLSPIQQAFKYKPQYKECGFVIATNFFELRLFRDNQLDYEKFTLNDLVDPKDDYFNFRKFFFLLNVQNFVTEKGQTETELLLSAIRIEQEKITNRFYTQYKELRESLITDIVKNNTTIKRADFYSYIVEKAQKIVDRVVFICFFEDCGLLPENRLTEVVEYAQKSKLSEPIWDTLKKFFKAVDEGSERLGVPNGYNGELFKPDEDLNNLKISDAICKRFVELSKFDFQEDLSVNILGHIFEQSITDLERLKQYSQGNEVATDKKDTKRKKDGIFYTPEYIVDYIVKNSLGKYLHEKEEEILQKFNLDDKRTKETGYNKKLIQAYSEYSQFLRAVKVLDPACGSGAFLVKVFDYLLAEHKRVFRVVHEAEGLGSNSTLLSEESYIKPILENNIYGVDLNPESVEITKLSLWLKSAQKGQKLITLKGNIKCGNSLIDDPNVAKDRAFNWSTEFAPIMNAGGFDVVVGNPPYVFARGGNFNEQEKEHYYGKYKLANYQINTFLLFIELSRNLLKKNGELGFIIPNNWLTINSFAPLREFILKENADVHIYNAIDKIFNQASVDTCLLFLRKAEPTDVVLGELTAEEVKVVSKSKPEAFFDNEFVLRIAQKDKVTIKFKDCLQLKDVADVKSGIVAYEVGKGVPEQTEEMKDNRVYHSTTPNGSDWIKYLEGVDVARYHLGWSGEYVKYGSNLAAQRKIELFNNPRIVVRQIPSYPPYCINAVYSEGIFVNDRNSNNIINIKSGYSYQYVLGVINSALLSHWFIKTFDKFQRKIFPQFKVNELEQFPIAQARDADKKSVENLVEKIMSANTEFIAKLNKSKELLRLELGLEKLPTKLNDFYELTFDEVLKISKAKLSLDKKSELMDFFTKQKDELQNLHSRITALDQETDELVYKIYGLAPEEIKVVEDFKKNK